MSRIRVEDMPFARPDREALLKSGLEEKLVLRAAFSSVSLGPITHGVHVGDYPETIGLPAVCPSPCTLARVAGRRSVAPAGWHSTAVTLFASILQAWRPISAHFFFRMRSVPMHLVWKALVHDAALQPPARRTAFFDGLLRLANGTWVCGFSVGAAKHHPQSNLVLMRSVDGGRTWQELAANFPPCVAGVPGSLAGAELVEAEPGRLLLFTTWFDRSDPERPLFDPATEGILHSRLLMAASADNGVSWSPWETIPTPGLAGCALTGPVLRWPDGTLALAFESFKEFDDPRPARHAAWVVISTDGGLRFGDPQLIAQDPQHRVYYWDQRLCCGVDSLEWIGLFWTHDRQEQRDLTVHLLVGRLDQGSEQSQPRPTSLPGQISAPLLWHDGRLFAFVVDRARPGTLCLWCSRDGGVTWPVEQRFTVHEHDEQAKLTQGATQIDFAEYWEDMAKWSFGHPAIRAYDDQHVFVTYYAGPPGQLSIHAALVNVA